jgi:hypothetical protein
MPLSQSPIKGKGQLFKQAYQQLRSTKLQLVVGKDKALAEMRSQS